MLHFRKPRLPWIVTALIGAGSVHAIAWFVGRVAASAELGDALMETQRQVILALFWMVCATAIWMIRPPKSRFSALLHVLGCAFFVCFLGSMVAFVNWMVGENIGFNIDNLTTFSLYALLMILAQLVLAVPSAALLQQIMLTRPPKTEG